MREGRIEQIGTPEEIYESPALVVRRRLRRRHQPAPQRVRDGRTRSRSKPERITLAARAGSRRTGRDDRRESRISAASIQPILSTVESQPIEVSRDPIAVGHRWTARPPPRGDAVGVMIDAAATRVFSVRRIAAPPRRARSAIDGGCSSSPLALLVFRSVTDATGARHSITTSRFATDGYYLGGLLMTVGTALARHADHAASRRIRWPTRYWRALGAAPNRCSSSCCSRPSTPTSSSRSSAGWCCCRLTG